MKGSEMRPPNGTRFLVQRKGHSRETQTFAPFVYELVLCHGGDYNIVNLFHLLKFAKKRKSPIFARNLLWRARNRQQEGGVRWITDGE